MSSFCLSRGRHFMNTERKRTSCYLISFDNPLPAAPYLKCVSQLIQLLPIPKKSTINLSNSTLLFTRTLPDTFRMPAFLDNLDIPCLNSDEQTNMDASISDNEATLAILSMQSGKAPGPDGFLLSFLKHSLLNYPLSSAQCTLKSFLV